MGGGLSSSAFGQSLGAAGSNLQSQLAQMMGQMRMGAGEQMFGQAQNAMGVDPFAYVSKQGSPSMLQSMMPGIAQGATSAGMNYLMNRPGSGGGQSGSNVSMGNSPLSNTYDQMFRTGAWS